MNEPETLLEAVQYFSDPDRALEFVVRLRWPGGILCPGCGHGAVRFISTRRMWFCKGCKRQFSAKVHTMFEDSPIGFEKWLPAMWLISNAKNDISSWELHRAIGVTQKTAWFMLHRIRLAMQTETFDKMAGHIEADELSWVWAARFRHPEKRAAKVKGRGGAGSGRAIVMGLLERHSDRTSVVRVKHVGDTTRQTLHGEFGPT